MANQRLQTILKRLPWQSRVIRQQPALPEKTELRESQMALRSANRSLFFSATSIGLVAAGLLTAKSLLLLASMPFALYVYTPAFRSTYRAIRKQQDVNGSLLDATRIAVCVVMGYAVTGAFNALFYALSQRMVAQSADEFEESLLNLLGLDAQEAWAFVNGAELYTQPDEIVGGQVLVANAGDILPAAGKILYGTAQIDQRLATGDVAPAQKVAGDSVLLASRVLSGQIAVSVDDNPERLDLNALRESLRRSIQGKTLMQQVGEVSGSRWVPFSLATFLLTIPWLGVNQAASFLATSFGGDMDQLGPTGTRNTVQRATQEGILIKESRVLELANFVNCLVIDGKTLLDPSVRLYAGEIVQELRQRQWHTTGLFGRPFAVYVLADQERDGLRAAAAALHAEDLFVEPLSIGRAAAIDNLQRSGRAVCYVGSGQDDGPVMEKALVSVALGGALSAPTNPAQVVFVEKSLAPLITFFDIAAHFLRQERFSLLTPAMGDITSIATTLFTPLGLLTSTIISYGSLLISLANARTPRAKRAQESEPIKTVAIVPIPVRQPRGKAAKAERKEARTGRFDFGFGRKKSAPSWLVA